MTRRGVTRRGGGARWQVVAVQRTVPDHLLGRVTAGHRTLACGSMPLGAGLAGVLGEALGVRPTFAALALAFLPALVLLVRNVDEPDIDAAETAGTQRRGRGSAG